MSPDLETSLVNMWACLLTLQL